MNFSVKGVVSCVYLEQPEVSAGRHDSPVKVENSLVGDRNRATLSIVQNYFAPVRSSRNAEAPLSYLVVGETVTTRSAVPTEVEHNIVPLEGRGIAHPPHA